MPARLFRRLAALFVAVFAFAALTPAYAIPRLLIDMQTGEVLFDEDAGVPWHPASVYKMMTA